MVINQAQLMRAVPNLDKSKVDEFVAYWNQWATHYGVDTKLRTAHALSQIFHESGLLKATEENMNYSADRLLVVFPKYFKTKADAEAYAHNPQKIANRVYGGRMGNGNEASGDGWKYRGRGLIGTTGLENYADYGKSDLCIGNPVEDPDILSSYPECLKSALFFWQKHDCNKFADADDCKGLTKRINGGLNGYANRAYLLRRFKKEFGL